MEMGKAKYSDFITWRFALMVKYAQGTPRKSIMLAILLILKANEIIIEIIGHSKKIIKSALCFLSMNRVNPV